MLIVFCHACFIHTEYKIITKLSTFLDYLWFHLVIRLGWRWWGLALLAFAVPIFVWRAHGCMRGTEVKKAVAQGLLLGYLVILLASAVFTRPTWQDNSFLLDFGDKLYDVLLGGKGLSPENVVNMLMLVPVGYLLPITMGWSAAPVLFTCFALTVGVESMQIALNRGWFELADIVLNSFGAVLGYAICVILHRRHIYHKLKET